MEKIKKQMNYDEMENSLDKRARGWFKRPAYPYPRTFLDLGWYNFKPEQGKKWRLTR